MPYTAFFAAANPHNDLQNVLPELKAINSSFINMEFNDVVKTYSTHNLTEDDIFNAYLSEADIRIFHFSGHAAAGALLMADGRFSQSSILAPMMSLSRHLNLVFLNGCATEELVNKFLENKANLVIATKAPVYDRIAYTFSTTFYEGLCEDKLSIALAFNKARAKLIGDNSLLELPAKNDKLTDTDRIEYESSLQTFVTGDNLRGIGRASKNEKGGFRWGIYFRDGITEEEKAEYENWKLIDEGPASPINFSEASINIIHGIAEAAISQKNINDPQRRLPDSHSFMRTFADVEELNEECNMWSDLATDTLVKLFQANLMLPLQKPFKQLMNHSKDRKNEIERLESKSLKSLILWQTELYKTFMKMATLIMVSDFMESTMKIGLGESQLLMRKFKELITGNPEFSTQLDQVICSEKGMGDIRFNIELMRNIVSLLKTGKEFTEENKLVDKKQKNPFNQFVREYHGNMRISDIDASLNDITHNIMIPILKKIENGDIDRMKGEVLRCYCYRAETALIELFRQHPYVLLYEIITIGKVEAIKQRDIIEKKIHHEVFFMEDLREPSVTEYGTEFAENYCVSLVSQRENLGEGSLSLCPFILNVGPFLEEDKSILFYFKRKTKDFLEYEYHDYNYPPDNNLIPVEPLRISLTNNDVVTKLSDETFLDIGPTIKSRYNRLQNKSKMLARLRFARVKDQFLNFEKMLSSLKK